MLRFPKQADELHDRDLVVGSRQHFDASVQVAATAAVSQERIESAALSAASGATWLWICRQRLVNAPAEPIFHAAWQE